MMNTAFKTAGFACITALVASVGQLHAQEAVKMPGTSASWVVDVGKDPHTGKGLSSIQEIQVTLDGDVRRDVIRWRDGRSSEVWRINGTWIGELPNGEIAALDIFGQFSPFGEWRGWDDGLLARYTQGAAESKVEFEGRPAILYQKELEQVMEVPFSSTDENPTPRIYTAKLWVDPETRLPIALDDDGPLYAFQFSDKPPKTPLEPPQKFLKHLEEFEQRSRVPVPQKR
jgi:hypothetical protein